MMTKQLYENVKQEIRSLLISSPRTKYGGLTGSLLYNDYKQMNCGKEIPYAELGFHSVLALLRSMPDVVHVEHSSESPSYRVHPVYDESTAHIQKMVLEQRDPYEYKNISFNQNWHAHGRIPSGWPMTLTSTSYYHHSTVQPPFLFFPTPAPFQSYPPLLAPPPPPPPHMWPQWSMSPGIKLQSPSPPKYEKPKFEPVDPSFVPSPSKSSKSLVRHESTGFTIDDYHLDDSTPMEIVSSVDDSLNTSDNVQIVESALTPPVSPVNPSIGSSSSEQPKTDDPSELPLNTSDLSTMPPSTIEEGRTSSTGDDIGELLSLEEPDNVVSDGVIFLRRINDAIRQCIHFRYIHRLCELKFEHRYHPPSIYSQHLRQTFEERARQDYEQELHEFERICSSQSFIDDEKCRKMFDEYIYLQRNYYRMIKLMTK